MASYVIGLETGPGCYTQSLEKPHKRGIIDGFAFRASAEAIYKELTVLWLLLVDN